ncbi:hypothetical protein LTR56_019967 [Elasticomyces elasticus]|nr:hypothetical protein LTR56_019967 [Elasticomyces elasticus]KAK3634076.1 hypothetical protein LTR22_019808 [Elasticomyces elasticus]KAK4911161.1 hypothetical protein LTR49_020233 [Elasticomyces elasticus]KAK5695720.1 hypothetical protein LTR17_024444 [Elasticomyces elasticus]KAK5747998.1 hypothetical protein LTS12_021927 [Elasticomyces elasticus]
MRGRGPVSPDSDDSSNQSQCNAKTPAQIARYLEDLTCKIMHAHNYLKNPFYADLVRQHTAQDLIMHDANVHDCPIPPSVDIETHISNVINLLDAHPCFEFVPTNVTAHVDRATNHAVVWVTEPGVGSEKERMFNRESVSRLHFRRRMDDGAWIFYKHMSIRGGGDFW